MLMPHTTLVYRERLGPAYSNRQYVHGLFALQGRKITLKTKDAPHSGSE